MEDSDFKCFDFTIEPIVYIPIRPIPGTMKLQASVVIKQVVYALHNYNSYNPSLPLAEKMTKCLAVAVFTRAADKYFMLYLQKVMLSELDDNDCRKCAEITFHIDRIRELLFPELKKYREKANKIIHYLEKENDHPLPNFKEAFDYCHSFFQLQDLFYGGFSIDTSGFNQKRCKKCRTST